MVRNLDDEKAEETNVLERDGKCERIRLDIMDSNVVLTLKVESLETLQP